MIVGFCETLNFFSILVVLIELDLFQKRQIKLFFSSPFPRDLLLGTFFRVSYISLSVNSLSHTKLSSSESLGIWRVPRKFREHLFGVGCEKAFLEIKILRAQFFGGSVISWLHAISLQIFLWESRTSSKFRKKSTGFFSFSVMLTSTSNSYTLNNIIIIFHQVHILINHTAAFLRCQSSHFLRFSAYFPILIAWPFLLLLLL